GAVLRRDRQHHLEEGPGAEAGGASGGGRPGDPGPAEGGAADGAPVGLAAGTGLRAGERSGPVDGVRLLLPGAGGGVGLPAGDGGPAVLRGATRGPARGPPGLGGRPALSSTCAVLRPSCCGREGGMHDLADRGRESLGGPTPIVLCKNPRLEKPI